MTQKKYHHVSSFASDYLKEIVYGGIDGIVTTFAVVAGFSGAQSQLAFLPVMTVLLFGSANLFADGISMALGSFLSNQADRDKYKTAMTKEMKTARDYVNWEQHEAEKILQGYGYSAADSKQMTTMMQKKESFWLDFLMKYELHIEDPAHHQSVKIALATFFSFVFFGAIPLAPYVIWMGSGGTDMLFRMSVLFTGAAMLLLGLLRWKVTKQHILRSIGETFLVGSIAALIAYLVGASFRL